MRKIGLVISAIVFVAGFAAGFMAAKGKGVDASTYRGVSPKDASKALLDVAAGQTGGGSWETIGVGRVLYLSGDKAGGQAYFDKATSSKAEKDDWMRVARVYFEAGEWDKAEPIFQKVLSLSPKDEQNLAEIGACYNLHGDRAKAEELFGRSFAVSPNVWCTLNAAGSYVGVKPQ